MVDFNKAWIIGSCKRFQSGINPYDPRTYVRMSRLSLSRFEKSGAYSRTLRFAILNVVTLAVSKLKLSFSGDLCNVAI